ncbi:uncharacterized protein RCC_10701 [Ramularia collo-cygni]|uniref:Protein kinase domain-containing protein n=1 Tax=Ramularia collo-cygni TaxID=112498 RepID=A0A2D3VHY5_9PEZI|nr:uncharacterized protein RCC_10701 [Ramularia collo-cygni]CZT24972.1 uncharacterized protein RCC_10701 [Ramularia collo-cygni]
MRPLDSFPRGVQSQVACSASNIIGLMEDGCSVLKYPRSPDQDQYAHTALREEANRYTCLGRHDNLVTFKAITDDGLIIEYCERGALYDTIHVLSEGQKICIGAQIARGLAYLHAQNFIHCDLNVRNIFMTSDFTAKIGDLQGQLSRPDGTIEMPAMTENNVKSRLPGSDGIFSAETDIFALGTLLYHVWYGHPPYPELDEFTDEAEIESKYRKGDFPVITTNVISVDKIIYKCWTLAYANAREILDDFTLLGNSPNFSSVREAP